LILFLEKEKQNELGGTPSGFLIFTNYLPEMPPQLNYANNTIRKNDMIDRNNVGFRGRRAN
jgi:hypothetical protein